jgi:lipoprotein-anchoring transpeptidase ErfK/SrfK
VLAAVPARTPITGEPTTLPVLGSYGSWLLVRLPGRPNGHTGWISEHATTATVTAWHLVIVTSTRRVVVYHSGRVARVIAAVVGKPETPTPPGEYFVEESIALDPSAVGAPFALALSARSNVLQDFDGGPGQIALHGLAHVGGIPGTAASHGCIRLANAQIRWLVGRIGAGTPVTIVP